MTARSTSTSAYIDDIDTFAAYATEEMSSICMASVLRVFCVFFAAAFRRCCLSDQLYYGQTNAVSGEGRVPYEKHETIACAPDGGADGLQPCRLREQYSE